MFTDKFVRLHLAKCALKTEERQKDERFPVFGVALVLEPLTYSLAKQLGPDVLTQCFSEKQHIRDMMSQAVVELDQPEQRLTIHMAEDVEAHCQLKQVRVPRISITKRDAAGDDDGARKSKKVGPQQPTLRATLHCLVDSAEKTHQAFLCDFFAKTVFVSFDAEQEDLFKGVHTDEDEDDEEETPQQGLRLAGRPPAPDPAAGDVLDENKPKTKRGRKGKADKK